jgi:hypothetical protein
MARKPKKRIDYAGWSVDIFSSDTKIDKLLDAQGWVGFGIYFYLCQMAFGSDGYFYEWCYDLCATTARKMGGGVGAGTVKETVDYCLQIGLFNQRLFDRWGVLTSRGIQKSYLQVLQSKNRQGTEIISDYWLLDKTKDEDYQGVVFIRKNNDSLEVNADSLEVNADSLEVNADSLGQNKSKVNDSKVNDSKVNESKGEKRKGEKKHIGEPAVHSVKSDILYFDNPELNSAFMDFLKMRKQIKKPMTDLAIKRAVTKLQKLSEIPFSNEMDEELAIKILNQSVDNCWQNLYELKEKEDSFKKSGMTDFERRLHDA